MQEAKESSEISSVVKVTECAWISPVLESEAITKRIAAKHGYEGVNDETDDEKDFAESEPEFGLAVPLDGKDVDDPVYFVSSGIPVGMGIYEVEKCPEARPMSPSSNAP